MQWISSRCYTAGTLIKFGGRLYQPPSTDQGQILYTGVGPHILLNCPILSSSVDSVATYSWKIPKIMQLLNFEFTGDAN